MTTCDCPAASSAPCCKYEDSGGPGADRAVRVDAHAGHQRPSSWPSSRRIRSGDATRSPAVFAEARYLPHWSGPQTLGPAAAPAQPVVQVSWFAARRIAKRRARACRPGTNGNTPPRRMPRAAMPAPTRPGANASSPGTPSRRTRRLAKVGQQAANAYGVHDLHGLVWEWVDDYSAMLVSGDNRDQGDPDKRSSVAPAPCPWTIGKTTRC